MTSAAALTQDLRDALPGLRTSDDDADKVAYARDLWPRQHLEARAGRPAGQQPAAIVWPETTEDVARIVRWAHARETPVVPFGAGSGVCAGVAPHSGVVVMDLKRLARIRSLDVDGRRVDVEAGFMGVPLEMAFGRAGLTLGHFPSSILCSTVGGWVAARSAGQCSGAYGKIEDMVSGLECVTGRGDVVTLRRRASGPDLVPLVVGSEGTLAVVTSATLRLHPAPAARAFGAWSFPTTRDGWEAIRSLFQAGLRPAVSRLYDPFDAMLAKQGGVKAEKRPDASPRRRAPGLGGIALRAVLRRPGALNELLDSAFATQAMGGALLVVIFEGGGPEAQVDLDRARSLVEARGGRWDGEAQARKWLAHRYSVSYRQAPVFERGAFVDTMEVAARWSRLGALYDAVREALGRHVFVMAHFSHAYPDGCCIYFSFAGSADPGLVRELGWDGACEATYDRAWKAAQEAAIAAGGTLSHHHGVGRSKAPRLRQELGAGVEVVRSLQRAFDPGHILNPGNLLPEGPTGWGARAEEPPDATTFVLDRESGLACVAGGMLVDVVEARLRAEGLTLDASLPAAGSSVSAWLGAGAPGARDRWLDPVDQLLAGLDARLPRGHALSIRPAPRRAVGPDLTALFLGAGGQWGTVERAWLRVHDVATRRPVAPAFACDRDPPMSEGETALVDAISREARSWGGRP